MYERIRSGKYQNQLPFPKRVAPHCPGCQLPIKKDANFCSTCGAEIKGIMDACINGFKAAMKKYNEETRRLNELFKQELLIEFGLEKHPKADEIYSYVWDRGSSSGLHEVYSAMEDIHRLFT